MLSNLQIGSQEKGPNCSEALSFACIKILKEITIHIELANLMLRKTNTLNLY